jgi:hypothetical protein
LRILVQSPISPALVGWEENIEMRALIVGIVVFAVAAVTNSAQAEVTITAVEMNGDVVFDASGTLNLDAWTFDFTNEDFSHIDPSIPLVVVGPTPSVPADFYGDPQNYVRPDSLGTGGATNATSGSGDLLGPHSGVSLVVPAGYVSGDPLSGSATYQGETFASLGLEAGTYIWTWGTGATADTLTLVVDATTPIEQSSWGKIKTLFK